MPSGSGNVLVAGSIYMIAGTRRKIALKRGGSAKKVMKVCVGSVSRSALCCTVSQPTLANENGSHHSFQCLNDALRHEYVHGSDDPHGCILCPCRCIFTGDCLFTTPEVTRVWGTAATVLTMRPDSLAGMHMQETIEGAHTCRKRQPRVLSDPLG